MIGSIPSANEKQCGQYKLHSLSGAKSVLLDYYDKVLRFQSSAQSYIK